MGIYDRDYGRDDFSGGGYGPRMRFAFPPISPVIKKILIINVSVFLICNLIPPLGNFIFQWFSVLPVTPIMSLQIWRLISYQFLHGNIFHIFFNMLVLYFFGPMLENLWGHKKFLIFYLVCGATGGVLYTILVLSRILEAGYLVGASGGIYGILAAAAILFPRMRVYVFGIFPMTLAVFSVVLVVISLLGFIRGENPGGEAAHLMGMAAGAAYVLWRPLLERRRVKINKGNWQRKMKEERDFQQEVDRILEKVHNSGIASLTRKEKRTLKEATQREQQEKYP
jgi:membrane associated rhomboid family serine protease